MTRLKRKSIPYKIKFIPKLITKFLNWRGVENTSCWDFGRTETNYTLSGEIDGYEEMRDKLISAEQKKQEVEITYVKKYRRRFINQVI